MRCAQHATTRERRDDDRRDQHVHQRRVQPALRLRQLVRPCRHLEGVHHAAYVHSSMISRVAARKWRLGRYAVVRIDGRVEGLHHEPMRRERRRGRQQERQRHRRYNLSRDWPGDRALAAQGCTGILYRRFSQSKWKWRGSGELYHGIPGMEKPLWKCTER